MSANVDPKRADAGARRELLARLLSEESERPMRFPASSGQKRIWLAVRSAPGSPVYNCPLTFEVRGKLESEALESALAALTARHEALRTTFEEEDGELWQRVAPRGSFPLEHRLAEGDDLEARRSDARSYAKRFARSRFDLAHGPLYRAALVRVDDDESLLLLNAHHIVSDGWSQGIVLRELLAAYRARVNGDEIELPPLAIQYADFARWERQREPSPEALAFWKERLQSSAPLQLPLDFVRPPRSTRAGARLPVRVSAEARAHAEAVAERDGTSLFQVVFAAFQMLMAIWCRQERFVIGTPAHNRNEAEVEGLVGFFVSTVPVTVDVSGSPTLAEASRRARESVLASLAHGDVPFERLVALAGPHHRAPGMPPLVQALFVWQQSIVPEIDERGAALKAFEEDTGTSKFDLTLSLRPKGDALCGHVELDTALFSPVTIERMIAPLETVLESMHRAPETRLEEMRLGDGSFAPAGALRGASTTTAEAYARAVARFADEPAVETPNRRLTYRELDRAASALAARLRAWGHLEGEAVGLCLPNGAEAIAGIVAAWKRRSPYVPLDPDWPASRIERLRKETGARHCLGTNVTVHLDELLHPDAPRNAEGVLEARPDDLAYIIYTSGSTGEPKGVLVPHRALAHLDRSLQEAIYAPSVKRPARVGIFGALSFDTTVKQIVRLFHGDRLCPVPPRLKASPKRLARYLKEASLDVVDMTPSWLRVLLDTGESPSRGLVLLGGEPIDRALWCELSDRQDRGEGTFVNVYGPTEATVDATWTFISGEREPSIGRPLPETPVWLLDARSRPLPPGFVGEIAIGGEGVALGYLERPEESARAFTEIRAGGRTERVYRTGDFARLRADGALVFHGRRDRQVKRHGQRVELGEIEAVLRSHPAAADVAVVESEGRLTAWYVAAREIPPAELKEHAACRLPRGLVPDAFHRARALPRGSSGKIDLARLSRMAPRASRSVATPEPTPLAGEPLETVARIWSELLGAPPESGSTDFFAAGGDSLLGLRLLARIEKRFRVSLDVALLAASPTPETLAAAISSASRDRAGSLQWLRRGSGERAPLVLVHATDGHAASYRALASLLDGDVPVAGLSAPGEIPSDLMALAAEHARALRSAVPNREVVLGGWSLGGVVALEVARRLETLGVAVPLVVLLDSRLPSGGEPDVSTELPLREVSELAGAPVVERLAARSRALLRLWRLHRPASYDGEVLLLSAGGRRDAELWSEVAPRLKVARADLEHHSMMRPPQVAELARLLQRALDAAASHSLVGART